MLNLEEIKKQISGEADTSEEILKKYSRDASVFEVKPEAVVFPKNSGDVRKLVKWASEEKKNNPKISLTARSAGTDMSGGPLTESLVLDFPKYFNKILNFGPNFVEIEPGVFYRDFEPEAQKHGLLLPCYTASKSLNTVGGMVGNNSAGEKTLSYGQTKDYVEELNVVLSDGNEYVFGALEERELEAKLKLPGFEGKIYREMFQLIKENKQLIDKAKPKTSKNSAGYLLWEVYDGAKFNLAKLFVGSQGTLGLVTKIKFRLVEPKKYSRLLVMFLKDLKPLKDLVPMLVAHKPESLESFDDHTFNLAMRFLPGLVKKMRGGLLSLAFQFLPEAFMIVTGGVPKLLIISEFTGDDQEMVMEKAMLAQAEVEGRFKLKTHICKSAQEAEKYWTMRRESFALLRQHVSGKSTAPFIDDIAVRPENLPEFLPQLDIILAKYPSLVYTIAGHAGDGNFHIIPLMDLSREDQRQIIPKLSEEVYDLVVKYKGTITAEHNDGLIRTPFLEKMYGRDVIKLFEKTKQIFDPQNLFNPGKKVHGDWGYAMEHIKKN